MRTRRWLVMVVAGAGIVAAQFSWGTAAERPAAAGGGQASSDYVDPMIAIVDSAIDISQRRYLSADVHTPWQIMHGLLALRQEFRIKHNGKKVNALAWISSGVEYQGDDWFQRTPHGGRAHRFTKPYAFEGHPNQFLAILAMAGVPADHKLVTRGEETITVADMVRDAQMEVNAAAEPTWTLWALSHYLGPDAVWKNKHGEAWSIERLVEMQTAAPVQGAACGGSHGLFALTFARNAYLKTGRPLRGVWLEADQKIKRYIAAAQATQNSDGTFSANYFAGSRHSNDFETRLGTTGHTLEFLVLALPKQRLRERWLRHGVYAIASDLRAHERQPAKCGALYHALDALVIYRNRTRPKPAPEVVTAGGNVPVGEE